MVGSRPLAHPDISVSLNNVAVVLQAQNKLSESEQFLREAIQILIPSVPAGHPRVLTAKVNLAYICLYQGKTKEAVSLNREVFDAKRTTLPAHSPEVVGQLAAFSLALLGDKAWDEAEPLLRECLEIREKAQPNEWTTFNTRSMLGGALLGQKKFADAEPLLLEGYQGLKDREAAIPPSGAIRIPEAIDRLIELYTTTSKPDEVTKWQAERAKYPPPAAKTTDSK